MNASHHVATTAPESWTKVNEISDELIRRLAVDGWSDSVDEEARALLTVAAAAGRRAYEREHRDRLDKIISFWAATLRLRTGKLVLDPYLDRILFEWLPPLASQEMQARATGPVGIDGQEVRDARIVGQIERIIKLHNFSVINGRLVRTKIEHTEFTGRCSLERTALLGCHLVGIWAGDIDAAHAAMVDVQITAELTGRLTLSSAALRSVTFDRCEIHELVCIAGDAASSSRPDLDDMASVYELRSRDVQIKPVRFTECVFGAADFSSTDLRGALFSNCTFRKEANFYDCKLDGTKFERCTFGVPEPIGEFRESDFHRADLDDQSRLSAEAAGKVPERSET